MDDLLNSPLAYLSLVIFILATLLLLVALQLLKRGRTGPYWRLRRAAGQRGGQLFLIAMTLYGIALTLAFVSGLATLALNTALNQAGAQSSAPNANDAEVVIAATTTASPDLEGTVAVAISGTIAALPSATTQPTDSPLPTSTPQPAAPTLTEAPLPTATPTTPSPFEGLFGLTTPVSASRTPRAEASLQLVAAAGGITAQRTPDNPTTTFESGIRRIYFFFTFEGMDDGVAWTHLLYLDELPVQGRNALWNLGGAGEGFFFIGLDEGFPPGEYELQLIAGNKEPSRLRFTVA
jgi:hypothetical protein